MSGVDRDKAVSFGGNQAATKRLLRNFLKNIIYLRDWEVKLTPKKRSSGAPSSPPHLFAGFIQVHPSPCRIL
jgi:hypothetical protein